MRWTTTATLVLAALLIAVVSGAQRVQDPEAVLRLFADAQRLEQDGDLDGALRNYELLVQQFPQAALADDALLRVADGRWTLRDESASRAAIDTLKSG